MHRVSFIDLADQRPPAIYSTTGNFFSPFSNHIRVEKQAHVASGRVKSFIAPAMIHPVPNLEIKYAE